MFKFQINAKADVKAAAEIFIYGDIGESWWEETTSAAQFVRDLAALKNETITIRINSVGGSVPDALAIHNAIRRHPSDVTIMIDGMAMSAASLISMAAPCSMAENAIMMIHAPWTHASGNAQKLREVADSLDVWSEGMATSYARKSGMEPQDFIDQYLDGDDHYLTAAEAQAAGFVDDVVEAMPIAASLRVPASALSRYTLPHNAAPFVIQPAKAAQAQGGSDMDRISEIRALFAAYKDNPDLMALCDACIEDENMSVDQAKAHLDDALKPSAKAAETAAVAAGVRKEAQRRSDIEAAFQPFASTDGMGELLRKCLDDTSVSATVANQRLLAKLGESSTSATGTIVVRDNPEREKFNDGVVAAILSRAGKADSETRQAAKASGYHNFTLMEMAKASLSRANVDFSAMSAPQVAQAALTQTASDFSVLLESAMHKALLASYAAAGDTWSRFCRTGSVSDFRAHGRYRTGSIGNYLTVNEAGEYQNVAIPDGEKGSITATDKGLIINLTYQMIVNDDLGAFVGLASDLGRAGRRTVEAAVYAILAENSGLGPTMSDGDTLFHASHNNIGTGAALSAASIDADRVVMASQTDVSGNEFLDLRPSVWLGPLASGSTARVINDAQYDPDTANKLQKPNAVRGLFSDVVDTARLTGTRYYLFADPSDAPVIEVAFLNGEMEPYIVMEEAFSSRGAKYRATLDFGVAAIDYRGAVTNAGA